jgi:hypothetical protein
LIIPIRIVDLPFNLDNNNWYLDSELKGNEICIWDSRVVPYMMAEWNNGIRHDHKTCKSQRRFPAKVLF